MSDNNWIGVDLDGTLAHYVGFIDATHIGAPIPDMLARVLHWRNQGIEVRIFTARAALEGNPWPEQVAPAIEAIKAWCREHVGEELPITATKDYRMIELWDDRCVQVESNTGRPVTALLDRLVSDLTPEVWRVWGREEAPNTWWCGVCRGPQGLDPNGVPHKDGCVIIELEQRRQRNE